MYYRPREKYRHPLISLFLFILLVGMTVILIFIIGIYIGYYQVEVTTLAKRYEPTPTPTRSALLYVADGDTHFAEGRLFPDSGRLIGVDRRTAPLVHEQSAHGQRLIPQRRGG